MAMFRRTTARRGSGLVGTVARTAVIAGTATAVGSAVVRRRSHRHAAEEAEIEAQAQAADAQTQLEDVQNQLRTLQAQQALNASTVQVVQKPAELAQQIQQLQALNGAGILSDEEFEAGKAKLLGT